MKKACLILIITATILLTACSDNTIIIIKHIDEVIDEVIDYTQRIVLSSSTGQNLTTDNLTINYYNINTTTNTIINDWRKYTPNSDGLVLWMPFNSSGAIDYSGEDNDGTISGAVQTSGVPGGWLNASYSFLANDYIQRDALPEVSTTKDYTISSWVYSTDSTNDGLLIGNGPSGTDRNALHYYQTKFGMGTYNGTWYRYLTDDSFAINNWYYVVYVHPSNNSDFKIYVDGVEQAYTSHVAAYSPGYSFWIGGETTNSNYFNGSIAEPKIWNRSLTADEILDEYNRVKGGTSLAVLNMPFALNSSSTAKDYSTNGNDGTLVKTTWSSERGGSYVFDGVNDKITLSSFSTPSYDYSLSFWYYNNDASQVDTEIITECCTAPYAFKVKTYSGGGIGGQLCDGTHNPGASTGVDYSGGWHHVVLIRNVAINKLQLYVDDVLKSNADDTTAGYNLANTRDLVIGSRGASNYFNGSIDDVQIFDYALSDEQITQIYNDGLQNKTFETLVGEETNLDEVYSVNVTIINKTTYNNSYNLISNELTIN